MNRIIVTPLVGFENVNFGMARSEVRHILGTPIREFKKSKYSKNTTDDFGSYHVFFDMDDKLEAVEFFEETLISDNQGNDFPKAAEALNKLPYHFKVDSDSYICSEYSIGIYAPGGRIESILFACKGYY